MSSQSTPPPVAAATSPPAPAEPAPDVEPDGEPEGAADAVEVEDVPLNRADRRARAKQNDPSHVGPRAGRTGKSRGARSHTKRQI